MTTTPFKYIKLITRIRTVTEQAVIEIEEPTKLTEKQVNEKLEEIADNLPLEKWEETDEDIDYESFEIEDGSHIPLKNSDEKEDDDD